MLTTAIALLTTLFAGIMIPSLLNGTLLLGTYVVIVTQLFEIIHFMSWNFLCMDALSEDGIFKLFEEETADKTAIIVTHKIASIRFCDRIIVMNDGKIEAIGDHENLMQTCRIYQELYRSVESFYE